MVLKLLAKKGLGLLGNQKTTGTEVISGVTKKPRSTKEAKLGELKVARHKLKGQMKRLKDSGDKIKDYISNK